MPARTLFTLAIASLLISSMSVGLEKEDKAECDKTKQKIRAIQSKMRSGYTRAQGEKMEAQLRKLRIKRKKACR